MTTFGQAVLVKPGEDEFQGSLVDFLAKTLPDQAQAGVVGSAFIKAVSEESPQRERASATTCDGAFTGEVFKESDHEHLEVDGRIDAGTSSPFGIGISGAADFANTLGEVSLRVSSSLR